jgi:hypothetical protein
MEVEGTDLAWVVDVPPVVWLFAVGVLAVLVLAAVEFLRVRIARRRDAARLRRSEESLAVRRAAGELGLPIEDDVPLVGRDSRKVVRVDHVVRLPASIAVVVIGPREAAGPVMPREGGAVWSVHVRGREINIPNPALRMGPVLSAFARRFPLVRLRGFLVLPEQCVLPPNVPRGVLNVRSFREALERAKEDDAVESQAVDKAWETIQQFVREMRERAAAPKAKGGKAGE